MYFSFFERFDMRTMVVTRRLLEACNIPPTPARRRAKQPKQYT